MFVLPTLQCHFPKIVFPGRRVVVPFFWVYLGLVVLQDNILA